MANKKVFSGYTLTTSYADSADELLIRAGERPLVALSWTPGTEMGLQFRVRFKHEAAGSGTTAFNLRGGGGGGAIGNLSLTTPQVAQDYMLDLLRTKVGLTPEESWEVMPADMTLVLGVRGTGAAASGTINAWVMSG